MPEYRNRPPRRFWPNAGTRLTIANIRGPWRPSGAVAACGVFAVVWSTGYSQLWAPLHDFEPIDQLRLIEMCRRLDGNVQTPGAWQEGFRA
jgi:hypothetical protein